MRSKAAPVVVLAVSFCAATLHGADGRPPGEVYESLYRHLEAGSFDKVAPALDELGKIPSEIERRFKVPVADMIRKAAGKGDGAALERGVNTLVYFDMALATEQCRAAAASPRKAISLLTRAAVYYQYVSPAVAKKDRAADREIKDSFKKAHVVLKKVSPYVEHAVDTDELAGLLGAIDRKAAAGLGIARAGE